MDQEILAELCQKFGPLPEVVKFDESLYNVDLSSIMTSGIERED